MVQTRSICCRLRRHCCWWPKVCLSWADKFKFCRENFLEHQHRHNGYDIEFNINREIVTFNELNILALESIGENVAFYFENEDAPAVVKGNALRVVSMENKSTPQYTGSHEIGHLIGLKHPYPKNSKKQKESKNIMGYSIERDRPTVSDAYRFFNKLNLKQKEQIIKGDKYDK